MPGPPITALVSYCPCPRMRQRVASTRSPATASWSPMSFSCFRSYMPIGGPCPFPLLWNVGRRQDTVAGHSFQSPNLAGCPSGRDNALPSLPLLEYPVRNTSPSSGETRDGDGIDRHDQPFEGRTRRRHGLMPFHQAPCLALRRSCLPDDSFLVLPWQAAMHGLMDWARVRVFGCLG